MTLTKGIVNKPTTLLIVFVLLVGLGLYSSTSLAVDLYPEINPPFLLINSNYEGTGPEEVEKNLTRILESGLSNVGNVETMTSTSSEGNVMIFLEFSFGTDMSEAANDVRDKLEFVREYLPEEATSPMIFKFDPSMIPIMYMVVTGNREPAELYQIAEKTIQPRLEQVDGVAMASISGGSEKIVRVEIQQNRLEAYNLTLTGLANMLRGQNIQIAAGSINEQNKNYLIRTSGEYQSIEEIRDTVIAYKGGGGNLAMGGAPSSSTIVRLRDIANVYEDIKEQEDLVYINGKPGVFITVQKQSGTNSVQTVDNVHKRLEKLRKEIPQGIDVTVIRDSTKIIRSSLNQVLSSAVMGAILAVLILLIFLRSLKSTIIIALSIPISFILTMMLMYFFGLTLNMMTLSGLILGMGMLVDNSIVILENIYRYIEKGSKPKISAILGSQEMINAIVASTLTTVCVFLPVAMFKDQLKMMGELFSALSFTVVFSLLSSLAVALFLVPILAGHFLPLHSRKQKPLKGFMKVLDDTFLYFFTWLDEVYARALGKVLKHRTILVLSFIAMLIVSLGIAASPLIGVEFMPNMEQDSIQLNVELPKGTDLETTRNTVLQVEGIAKKEIKGYKDIVVQAGEKSLFGFMGASQEHKGSLMITLPEFSKRIDTEESIKQKLRNHFNDFPAVSFSFGQNMGMSGSPIEIKIKTEDLKKGKRIADKIKEIIEEQVPEIVEPKVDMEEALPQIEIFIDRDKSYALGLNMYSIGKEIQANIDGITATSYREGGNEYDVVLILAKEDRSSLPDLDRIFLMNPMGQKVPLSSIARYTKSVAPVSISRENQARTISVEAALAVGATIDVAQPKLEQLVREQIPSDEDVIIEYAGDLEEMMEMGMKFIIIAIISLFLVFGVMASQFESLKDPFIIIFTIILIPIGIIMLFLITGEPISLFTAVGAVMLMGIVVNNAIVLVDYTNLLRKRGMPLFEACIAAGKNRLRPILMTSFTTILGLVPMAFLKGEGSDLVMPIGKTVIGGLTINTFLTLFLIPVIYTRFNGGNKAAKVAWMMTIPSENLSRRQQRQIEKFQQKQAGKESRKKEKEAKKFEAKAKKGGDK